MKTKNVNLEERRKKISELVLKNSDLGAYVYEYISDGSLDHILVKISDDITISNVDSNNILTGEEQFVDVLCFFVLRFNYYFAPLQHKGAMISDVLSSQVPAFLLCKNYLGDNKFIDFYKFNFKQCVVNNFYYNIKLIYNNFEPFFKKSGITDNMNLAKENDVNSLFDLMRDLVWCNYDQYVIFNLFRSIEEIIKTNKKENFKYAYLNNTVMQWELLIDNYNLRIDAVRAILSY